jgi:hypothetical protein
VLLDLDFATRHRFRFITVVDSHHLKKAICKKYDFSQSMRQLIEVGGLRTIATFPVVRTALAPVVRLDPAHEQFGRRFGRCCPVMMRSVVAVIFSCGLVRSARAAPCDIFAADGTPCVVSASLCLQQHAGTRH